MRTAFWGCIALLALLSLVDAADDPTASLPGVTDLTPDNFADFTSKTTQFSMIEFYAPWCGKWPRLLMYGVSSNLLNILASAPVHMAAI